MVHATQDFAAFRLAKRIALGLGTPFEPTGDPAVAKGVIDYGVFTFANLPLPGSVPIGSRATAVNLGTVWNTGTNWVASPALTTTQLARQPYVLAQEAGVEYTAAAATFATITATSSTGGTKTRLTSAGNHGLSTASNGRLIHVSADSGITAGPYVMTYVSAKVLDITYPYQALTNTVVGTVASPFTFYSVTVPGGAMGANGLVQVEIFLECSATATAKALSMVWGGTGEGASVAINGNTLYSMKLKTRICNQNAVDAQRISELDENALTASQAGAATRDTTDDQIFSLLGTVAAADEFLRLSSIQVTVYPHA